MDIILIILGLVAAAGLGALMGWAVKVSSVRQLDREIEQQNNKYYQESLRLERERQLQLQRLDTQLSSRFDQLRQATEAFQNIQEQEQTRLQKALSSYVESLEFAYLESEEDFDKKIKELKEELEKMRASRAANIQAVLREKELKEKENFYKITISAGDLADIEILEEVKPRLRHPEVLCKLIWTTYYQKAVNTLCNNLIGDKIVTGIYKITDSTNGLVYIGKSVNIALRWKDHIKAALGASNTASNNKLYAAMRENGVHNFTFEVLEVVSSAQLNEKEKYYIDFYQSSTFGLNVVKGNVAS